MGMWLRQSTAGQEVLLGPFLDSSDGNTAETGLTIANTDIQLWKEGATTEANKNSGGATHIANGRYYAVLDATDTDTLGKLEINVHVSGALAVRREFMVVPANVYDSLILGTDTLESDTVAISGDTTAADNAELAFDGTGYGFTGCTMPTVTTLTGHTAQTGDTYAALPSNFSLLGINASGHVSRVVLCDTTTTNSDMRGTDSAALASVCTETRLAQLDAANLPADIANLNDPTAEAIADAVWDEAIAGHTTSTTFGGKNQKVVPSETVGDYKADVSALATSAALATVDANVDDILLDTDELQTDWTDGGRLDNILDSVSGGGAVNLSTEGETILVD